MLKRCQITPEISRELEAFDRDVEVAQELRRTFYRGLAMGLGIEPQMTIKGFDGERHLLIVEDPNEPEPTDGDVSDED